MYDVIIIGGGPAGMTAGIYSSRRGLKTLIISSDIGGQITKTSEVENYPGFDLVTGIDLANNFFIQAKKFGCEFDFTSVKEIKEEKPSGFSIITPTKTYEAKSIILAFGKKPRELSVPGEEEFKGRGVSYCATCDAPFFKGKDVAVVGGGNSALNAAIITSKVANQVYLIHRRDQFSAEAALIEKITQTKNIKTILNNEVTEITGEKRVSEITLKNDKKIKVDGVLVEVGFVIDRGLIKDFVKLDKLNQVVVNNLQETSKPGIFAAGDLTQTPYKQVVIAAGEGAKAALSCFDYLQQKEGKRGIKADWH